MNVTITNNFVQERMSWDNPYSDKTIHVSFTDQTTEKSFSTVVKSIDNKIDDMRLTTFKHEVIEFLNSIN